MNTPSADLWAEYEKRVKNFRNPNRNGATAGSLGTRNEDEQSQALAARELMKRGEMYSLKRKSNPFR